MKKAFYILTLFFIVSSCTKDENPDYYVSTVLPPGVENFQTGTHGGEFALFWDYQYNSQINGFSIVMNPGNEVVNLDAYNYFYVVADHNLYNHYLIRAEDKSGVFSEAQIIDLTK